jgi:hypothetical protein
MAEQEVTIPWCPFCAGKPEVLKLPGARAVCCTSCGALGPAAHESDFPGRTEAEALNLWKKRGGVGNTRIAAVQAGVTPDTCIVAENLQKAIEKVMANEYGNVDVSVLLLLDTKTKRLGIIKHRLDDLGFQQVLQAILSGLVGPGGPLAPQRQHGGLIIPGR